MTWTSDDLIARARLYAFEPTEADGGLTDAEVLSLIQGELEAYVLPRVVLMREEFGIVDREYTIVANREAYRIPPRALGSRLRDVVYVDPSGERYQLTDINLEQLKTNWREPRTDTRPYGYFVQNNSVHLVPTPTTAAGTLLLRYPLAAPTLVAPYNTAYCLPVGSVTDNVTAGAVVLTKLTFSTVPVGYSYTNITFDIVRSTGGLETVIADEPRDQSYPGLFATGSNGYVSFGTDVVTSASVAAGDYLCVSGYAPSANVPVPMQPWLALRGACRVLELRGNETALGIAQRRASEMESTLVDYEQPRVESASKLLIPRNSPHRRWR